MKGKLQLVIGLAGLLVLTQFVGSSPAADINDPHIRIQYMIDDGNGFRDALYFTAAEFAEMKDSTLKATVEERIKTYQAFIENPPEPVEPSKEQFEQQADELRAKLAEVESKIDDVVVEEKVGVSK